MTPESQDLLNSARASGKDDHDPEIAAILRDHPELRPALEARRVKDLKIAESFRAIEPPPGLEDRLLQTLRETRAHTPSLEPVVVPTGKNYTRRSWMAAAASVALASGGFLWWRHLRATPLNALLVQLVGISRKGVTLSLMSMDSSEVRNWLVTHHAPRSAYLPDALEGLPRKGCHLYQIDGHSISLECFLLPGMRELHLFTMDTEGITNLPPEGGPVRYESAGDLTTAVWTRGGKALALIAAESREVLGGILADA